jgi:YggT family protein
VGPVGDTLSFVLLLFLVFLIIRLIMEMVFVFARSYRPSGVTAMALELVFSVTDPPLKALRRVLPPLRIGGISLDLAFLVLIIVVQILRNVVVPSVFA